MSALGAELLIRPFQVSDQHAVRKLILDGLGDHFPMIDATLNPDLDDIGASYSEVGHIVLVAELNGGIVAAGALIGLSDRVGRVVRVSVDKGHRRQRIGVNLVTRLIELARDRQYQRLVVETNLDWLEAIALYRSLGFQPYARDQESVHMDLDLKGA